MMTFTRYVRVEEVEAALINKDLLDRYRSGYSGRNEEGITYLIKARGGVILISSLRGIDKGYTGDYIVFNQGRTPYIEEKHIFESKYTKEEKKRGKPNKSSQWDSNKKGTRQKSEVE